MGSAAPENRDEYAALRDRFRWTVPPGFNIGRACSDLQAPGALAVVDLGDGSAERRRATFGDLAAWSNSLANALSGTGVRQHDRVAVVLPQCLETVVSHLGIYKAGAVVVPLTVLFGPEALGYRLGNSGTSVVITDVEHEDLVRSASDDLACQIWVVGSARAGEDFWSFVSRGSAEAPRVETDALDPALMIYTSGTTGAAKGALHGHRVLLGHMPGFELGHNDYSQIDNAVSWTPADWSWIGGLFDVAMPTLFSGGTLIASQRKGFDPSASVRLLLDERVTSTFLPPTALRMLANEMRSLPDQLALQSLITGGEPLDVRTNEWGVDVLRLQINEMYGQTEANFLAGNSRHWPVKPGYLGRPYPGHSLDVVAEDGQSAADGAEGEIVLRLDDPVAMLKYWDNDEATQQKVRCGVLHTGDLGIRDADGYLRFIARNDDVINSAGYRIGPAEVENCLLRHPSVLDVAVIGVPDDVRGERVKAFVVSAEPSTSLADELREFVRLRLGKYQYPREIEFIEEIPKTTTGKLRRQSLRGRH